MERASILELLTRLDWIKSAEVHEKQESVVAFESYSDELGTCLNEAVFRPNNSYKELNRLQRSEDKLRFILQRSHELEFRAKLSVELYHRLVRVKELNLYHTLEEFEGAGVPSLGKFIDDFVRDMEKLLSTIQNKHLISDEWLADFEAAAMSYDGCTVVKKTEERDTGDEQVFYATTHPGARRSPLSMLMKKLTDDDELMLLPIQDLFPRQFIPSLEPVKVRNSIPQEMNLLSQYRFGLWGSSIISAFITPLGPIVSVPVFLAFRKLFYNPKKAEDPRFLIFPIWSVLNGSISVRREPFTGFNDLHAVLKEQGLNAYERTRAAVFACDRIGETYAMLELWPSSSRQRINSRLELTD